MPFLAKASFYLLEITTMHIDICMKFTKTTDSCMKWDKSMASNMSA